MKDTHLVKQKNGDPAPLALGHFRTKLGKKRLNEAPLDIGANRASENCFQGLVVLSLHGGHGTNFKYYAKAQR